MVAIRAMFFDARDTLGYVDRPGHLVTYKPSTEELLKSVQGVLACRVGIITNLPSDVSSATGLTMMTDAGVTPFLDPDGFITNHDAGFDKPSPEIYRYAADKFCLPIEECLFVGENFLEVLGARVAGMQAQLKPSPPGREFLTKDIAARPSSEKDSGRLSETIMEEDHLIGRRLVIAASGIAGIISAGGRPPLRSMGLLTFLLHEFIDRYHHAVEERVLLPLAFANGFDPKHADYVFADHDAGRKLFATMSNALAALRGGDAAGANEFRSACEAFVTLYREHARRENDETLPAIGAKLTNHSDAVMVELMARSGPGDLGPWLMLIADLEADLKAATEGAG